MGDDDSPKSGQFDWSKLWIFVGAFFGVGILLLIVVYASRNSKGRGTNNGPNTGQWLTSKGYNIK